MIRGPLDAAAAYFRMLIAASAFALAVCESPALQAASASLIRVDAFVMLLLAGALAPTIVRGA